ncbi:hypothetical protein [Peptostreptococcus anaerobius]
MIYKFIFDIKIGTMMIDPSSVYFLGAFTTNYLKKVGFLLDV